MRSPSPSECSTSPEAFEPQWPQTPTGDGVYIPDTKGRILHPASAPDHLLDLISSTYTSSIKASGVTLSEFTLFPLLPLELRQKIWRYTLPGPRVAEVFYDDDIGECKSPCSLSVALHVNYEARLVALKTYELCFGTSKAPPMVYFNMGH